MYKITFQLAAPVSFIDRPTFDGILAYAFARELNAGKREFTKQSFTESELIDFSGMPITRHRYGYFIASQLMYDESRARETVQRWRKRWDQKNEHFADFGKNRRKVDVQRGEFKSYDMPIRLVAVPEVWFVFESDNVAEVERLVAKHIFSLGKKRTVGHGEIAGFSISETDEPVIRPIPERFFTENTENAEIRFCTFAPPYWDVSKAEKCVITSIKAT